MFGMYILIASHVVTIVTYNNYYDQYKTCIYTISIGTDMSDTSHLKLMHACIHTQVNIPRQI